MTERDKVSSWKKRGRGRGLRWHIQREILALLSRKASNTTDVQATMTRLRGISHKKTIELLRELEIAKCVMQEHDKYMGYYWIATTMGISVYIGDMKAIPSHIVDVLLIPLEYTEEKGVE